MRNIGVKQMHVKPLCKHYIKKTFKTYVNMCKSHVIYMYNLCKFMQNICKYIYIYIYVCMNEHVKYMQHSCEHFENNAKPV